MAADETGVRSATATLTANTLRTFNLTGQVGTHFEIIHHGNADEVVYAEVASSEAELTSFALAADDLDVVLSGERLTTTAPRDGLWVRLRSAGTPTVTVLAIA